MLVSSPSLLPPSYNCIVEVSRCRVDVGDEVEGSQTDKKWSKVGNCPIIVQPTNLIVRQNLHAMSSIVS